MRSRRRGAVTTSGPRRAFRLIWLAPLLAVVALGAWAFASPIGAAPDDDYHLTSVWCAIEAKTSACEPGESTAERVAPEGVVEAAHCYRWDAGISAGCQGNPGVEEPDTETSRGNFRGGYPPLYYAAMSIFVGADVSVSAMVMRLVNVLLFVSLTTALVFLLPRSRRPMLLWAWAITLVPLSAFLIASNSPSGWSIVGVVSAWAALVGFFETRGTRRIALGLLAGIATLMAAGARGDSAMYVVIGLGVACVLSFVNTRRYWLSLILPAALAVVALLFFLSARQIRSGVSGFSGVGRTEEQIVQIDPVQLWVGNLLNLPTLWAGFFGGSFGLGWLDTILPSFVTFAGALAFLGMGFLGLRYTTARKTLMVIGLVGLLYFVPVWVLGRGLHPVGEQVQPRYLLPLLVLLGGVLLYSRIESAIRPTRLQSVVLVLVLSAANALALHATMRRFVLGLDGGLNLSRNVEWWWNIPVTPMVMLGIGSLAFAALLVVVVRELAWSESHIATPLAAASAGRPPAQS